MPVDPNDYRLKQHVPYALKGLRLTLGPYKNAHPSLGPDHCEFCSATFGETPAPGRLAEGWHTDDGYRWIRKRCFDDFKEHFGWKAG